MVKKRIKILTRGAIRVRGFINGPVLTPYYEDISTIFAMVSEGIHIVEVCEDGTEIRLTSSNFAEDNNKPVKEHIDEVIEPVHAEEIQEITEEVNEIEVIEPVQETLIESEDVSEETSDEIESSEESIDEVTEVKTSEKETQHKDSYKHHNNNYKNNKNHKKR